MAGGAQRVGDSLIWTATAIGVLPCEDAARLVDRLVLRLEQNGGLLVRYEPLPAEYADGNEISFDGETGVEFGLARFLTRCGDAADRGRLAAAWRLRLDAVAAAGGHLHPNVDATVPGAFKLTGDALAHELGLGGAPARDRHLAFEAEAAAFIGATVLARASCFRLNLAYEHLSALEAMGFSSSGPGRQALCAATDGVGVLTWDHWCGRPGLEAYAAEFHDDTRLQRCDYQGAENDEFAGPGVHYLWALRILYGDSLP